MKPYFYLILAKLRNPRCKVEYIEFEDGIVVKQITIPGLKSKR
jgi:hypothetical protein